MLVRAAPTNMVQCRVEHAGAPLNSTYCSADNVNANGTLAQLAGLPGQVPYYIFGAGEGTSSNTYQVHLKGQIVLMNAPSSLFIYA